MAASFVIIVAWIYCSASIFLFAGDFTQVYASCWGNRLRHAAPVGELSEERRESG